MDSKAIQKIGQKAGIKWGNLNIDPEQLKKGLKIEREHKDLTKGNRTMEAKITTAHLKEDPGYYKKLDKMEEKPKENLDKKKKREILKNLVKGL